MRYNTLVLDFESTLTKAFVYVLIFVSVDILNGQQVVSNTLKETVTGMEFVAIPKGAFLMGNPEVSSDTDETVFHKVYISKDFWLGKTEVTQQQWTTIMGNAEPHPDKPSPFRGKHPDYPVVSISYLDVELFIQKLNTLSKKYHFRLPTEAEWEYACRAGTTTPFFYGTTLSDTLANYNATISSKHSVPGQFKAHPSPVASYSPNNWGIYDMHGNVWEWVSDWYAPYAKTDAIDPQGPSRGMEKVIRGGSWYFGASNALSYHRRTHVPELWGFSIGFRLVCEEK